MTDDNKYLINYDVLCTINHKDELSLLFPQKGVHVSRTVLQCKLDKDTTLWKDQILGP